MNRTRNKFLIICRSSRFPVFQLHHYGFEKIDSGADRGAFYHPQFQRRDKVCLCLAMDRKNDRKHLTSLCTTPSTSLLRGQADRRAVASSAGHILGMISSPFENISPEIDELSSQMLRDEKHHVAFAGFSNETVRKMQVARHDSSSGWPILPLSRGVSRFEQHQPPLEAPRGQKRPQLSGGRHQRLDWLSVLEENVSAINQFDYTVLLDLEPRSIEEMRSGRYNKNE
jgi:hypothetical protein